MSVNLEHEISHQIVGERGWTAFPFRFWRPAVSLAYTTAVGERDTDSDQEHAGGRYTVISDISISMWTADIWVQARTVREVLAVQARVCWWHQS